MQLIEAYIPNKHYEKTAEKLFAFPHKSHWVSEESADIKLVRMIVEHKQVEEILNYLEGVANVVDGFQTILFPVQTYISRETLNEDMQKEKEKETTESENSKLQRASRQELIQTIEKNSFITTNYTLLIILSAVVATVGFIKNSEAVVIGAMVIAPMLGPVISIAFSAILGDYKKIVKAMVTFLFGFIIVIIISIFFSYIFKMGTDTDQFIARTEVTLSDFILALASGAAGALAILNRMSGNLVGVMVAVALLPPTVAFGLSIGQGLWDMAYGSFMLIIVNTTCILLSAITIFSISGIRPVRWLEVKKANVSRIRATIFIGSIVGLLILVILISQGVKFE
ncbi:putative hydrophobic protein (TIGR00341 family) [Salirhabdus euzebyi]|uniref:Putative hydrophobic protein (TIGR00341 family) n=1 Tax=Salirhabdus euzebyi TaxID=394506 RepID=A0A841PSN1_9BACI|nr:TIGR00341 family protein [Salirhabdus euzebyi]MBB6451819.1 putative hydrophobic protein (TIGR00341 family) [Salirhabdus euzebyi]